MCFGHVKAEIACTAGIIKSPASGTGCSIFTLTFSIFL